MAPGNRRGERAEISGCGGEGGCGLLSTGKRDWYGHTGSICHASHGNGKIVGMGAASMCPAYAVLEAVVCDDDTIAYGMGKAMLNSLDMGGIGYVLIKNESIYPLAKRLRFQETTEGTYRVSLDGYFTSGCGKSL